jgi:hypothetical protein
MCPWPDRPSPASHPSWCTLSNHSFGLASKTDWVPSLSECRECPDHPGVRLKLNLNRVPICAVSGCDYGP